jgi:putative SOS response-associated peptidase YedK
MCGRFTITTDRVDAVLKRFRASMAPGFEGLRPRFNVSPGQDIPAILAKENGERFLTNVFWGFIPPWGEKDPGRYQANIRDDTIGKNRFFQERLLHNRCIILADGFYEWQTPRATVNVPSGGRLKKGTGKIPHRIVRKDRDLFAFAGLWRSIKKNGALIVTAAIITTAPNDVVRPIHNRMPVILSDRAADYWLTPSNMGAEELLAMLGPYPDGLLDAYPVSTIVNNSRTDSPVCIEPLS